MKGDYIMLNIDDIITNIDNNKLSYLVESSLEQGQDKDKLAVIFLGARERFNYVLKSKVPGPLAGPNEYQEYLNLANVIFRYVQTTEYFINLLAER